MSNLRIILSQTQHALIVALRTKRLLIFGTVFPVVMLILFNSIFAADGAHTMPIGDGLSLTVAATFTAGLASFAIMQQGFTALLTTVTAQRETGQLKRLRGTPVPAWTFIVAQVLRAFVMIALMLTTMVAIGAVVYHVPLHAAGLIGLAVYALLAAGAFATLGLAVTVFTPTADTASTVGPFGAVILSFISGVFIPSQSLPPWLISIGKAFPLYSLANGFDRALAPGGGTGLTMNNVLLLAAWGIVGAVVAARSFRWEPQGSRG